MIATGGRTGATLRHSFADGIAGWEVIGPVPQVGRWLGRDALRLEGGGVLVAPVWPEPPYSVATTLASGAGDCYAGACFHLRDPHNYETVYLAPHLGGSGDAIQYDPALNGSMTWQVFAGAGATSGAALARERWHQLRLDVWPDVVQVHVDSDAPGRPSATFALRTGFRSGRVGVWSYLPCHVAEFAVAPLDAPPPEPSSRPTAPHGTVREWRVGREDGIAVTGERRATVEPNGTLCFNRLWSIDDGSALAACEVLVGDRVRELALELGYSDRATVWWDGTLVHEGEWRWNPAKATDGRIRQGQTRIVLPAAVAGYHLLRVRVEVVEPFGWGLTARVLADGVPCPTTAAPALD